MPHFLSFQGRATGAYTLGTYVALLFAAAILAALSDLLRDEVLRPYVSTAVMALVIPTFVRRMHDNGRSGWWAIFPSAILVPRTDMVLPLPPWENLLIAAPLIVAGLFAILLLINAGNGDPSRFGPDPRARREDQGSSLT